MTIAKENHPPVQLRNSGTNLQYVSTPKQGVADAKALAGGQGKIKVRDGIVVLRNFLDVETQRWLAEICFSMGDEASGAQTGATGFYQLKKSDKGASVLPVRRSNNRKSHDLTTRACRERDVQAQHGHARAHDRFHVLLSSEVPTPQHCLSATHGGDCSL